MPKLLDPFAGGGAIPLEALRLGCEAHAIDLNPVAHLIELCTLVYPQKYGRANSRPVPDYIKKLISHNKAKRKTKGQESADLFPQAENAAGSDEIIANVQITEAEYLSNPLAADVKYWGHWVLEKARPKIESLYPVDSDGGSPVAYLWARTVKCPNPQCGAVVPLIRQLWLCKKSNRKVAIRIILDQGPKKCRYEIAEGKSIDFDPESGTMQQGRASCPFCRSVIDGKLLRSESKARRMGQQMMAVLTSRPKQKGKNYRAATREDERVYSQAVSILAELKRQHGTSIVPTEEITPDRPSPNSRGLSAVSRYGFDEFGLLFNDRQSIVLITFSLLVKQSVAAIAACGADDYAKAVASYLALAVSRLADFNSCLCILNNTGGRGVKNTFARQALPMVWDYAESAPFNERGANWKACVKAAHGVITRFPPDTVSNGSVSRGTATALPWAEAVFNAVITDPPYYDSVPYSDLSDFFYVWLKRAGNTLHPDLFRTPLTPKAQELIAYYGSGNRRVQKLPEWYEEGMRKSFLEINRVLSKSSISCVMFAHKTTAAWESLIAGLLQSSLIVSASWPLHTERKARMVARKAAALASSVTLVCRKRELAAGDGLWDDVRQELKPIVKERLDFFWSQCIRGADFFISAIGPALSVFGKYERVTKLTGEEVTVGQFLDEVRGLVTAYALNKIMKTTQTASIDPESRFYVIWKWSYGDAKVPADESFKLAQALGMDTDIMWDRTGVLEKSGENVLAVPVAKRMRIKDLGEPNSDGSPASLIDVLHRLCVFRDKGDSEGMAEFFGRSGQGRNPNLWLVAQAVSEILPDGDKEKQLMQGLLNQRDQLEKAGRQANLY
jgi:adenine-specific DNA methylase